MCAKSYVFLIGILFNFHIIKSQRPPKVPQIFPPSQPTFIQTQQPNEMPLSLQALYGGCPKSSGNSENCKNKLLNIVDFLLERETGERRKVDSTKILQAKEMLKKDNKKLILDATKNTIEHILAKNYQYQAVSSKVLRQSLGQTIFKPPTRQSINYKNNSPVRHIINKPNHINPGSLVQTQPQLVQTHQQLVQTQPQLIQTQSQLVQTQPQLVQTQTRYKTMPVRYNVDPTLVQNQNVNPVIPVTSISGQISDNDDVLVFYKPKVVTYSQLYDNGIRKFSKRILVPYYVSKLN